MKYLEIKPVENAVIDKLKKEIDKLFGDFKKVLQNNCKHSEWSEWFTSSMRKEDKWKSWRFCYFCGKVEYSEKELLEPNFLIR